MKYEYLVTSSFRVLCVRNVREDGPVIRCEENRVTCWAEVTFPALLRRFEKESDACRYAIDEAETTVRDLTRQMMHADDREADEAAELETEGGK